MIWQHRLEGKFSKHSGEIKEFKEVWKDVSLRLTLNSKGGNWRYLLAILLILTWRLRYPQKRWGNRKRGRWNRGLRHLLKLVLVFQKNSCRTFLYFHVYFLVTKKKRIVCKSSIFLKLLINELFWFP